VADLHLWSIGPNIYALVMVVVAHHPATSEEYRARVPKHLGIVHMSIECQQASTKYTGG
jgi:hypothetical protein